MASPSLSNPLSLGRSLGSECSPNRGAYTRTVCLVRPLSPPANSQKRGDRGPCEMIGPAQGFQTAAKATPGFLCWAGRTTVLVDGWSGRVVFASTTTTTTKTTTMFKAESYKTYVGAALQNSRPRLGVSGPLSLCSPADERSLRQRVGVQMMESVDLIKDSSRFPTSKPASLFIDITSLTRLSSLITARSLAWAPAPVPNLFPVSLSARLQQPFLCK